MKNWLLALSLALLPLQAAGLEIPNLSDKFNLEKLGLRKNAAPPPAPAAPPWAEKPYQGLSSPEKLRVGIGFSEAKPDPDVTRLIAYAKAALDLMNNVQSYAASLHRDYEADEGAFLDQTVKGVTIRNAQGFCIARFLLHDYQSAADDEDDEQLVEQAMKLHFPPAKDPPFKVFLQEFSSEEKGSHWARLIIPAASSGYLQEAAPEKPSDAARVRIRASEDSLEKALSGAGVPFKVWDNPASAWIKDYSSEIVGHEPETSLQAKLKTPEGEKLWVEQSVEEGDRVGILVSSGAATQYVFDRNTDTWGVSPTEMDLGFLLDGAKSLDSWTK